MAVKCRVLQGGIATITQPYHINGQKGYNYNHWGIDLTGFNGSYNVLDWIVAHTAGTVVDIRTNCRSFESNSYGNYVLLKHDNGMFTMYAHMAYGQVKVSRGQRVSKGQVLGYADNTGTSYGGHLHFEIRQSNGNKIDPQPYLNADLPGGSIVPGAIFTYQVWEDVKRTWLPNVQNANGYAGNFGHDVDRVYVNCNKGDVWYCVHTWAGDNKEKYKAQYLPEVKNREDYAGLSTPIDAFALMSNVPVKYRVHLRKQKRWLPWVTGYDWKDADNGYAGIIGEPIDAIQIAPR